MSSEITQLIDVGHDVTAIKYYGIAVCTILFYDYLLTLQDEIEYAWSGRKSWTFWLFIANRYFPMTYEFWLFAVTYSSNPNKKGSPSSHSYSRENRCDQSSFYSIIAFNVCTFLAQVVLTLRIYAVSKKNIPIATGFAIITISQAALGICTVVLAAEKGAQTLPPIPFDAYRLCVFIQHRTLEIVYTGISLFYDSLAFLLILFLARRSKMGGLEFTGILATIVEDATLYFLVIFTSHFVLEMTLALGRESIQLLPANGNVV
ncbi:hypothetical protein BJ322DRAFT_1178306 [Thelephora terrestris]|uniref:DUF6533 domain-containing protein n=1 Tax=Thelephora terrestris TaxID=56493 RepID=A0A9P6L9Q3_9AGAM|nr:hypothetical protein BJ322DRAFT_1178306 [Thelephora terrestris]